MRGGEKVLEVLCRMFPQAPLFTLMHVEGSVAPVIEDRLITTSPLQHMPFAAKKYRMYFPLFPAFAELTKAGDCDLVISTSHAVAKSMVSRKHGRPKHVCYIHSPMRYIWDRFDDYFGPEKVGKVASRLVFRPIAAGLQRYDRATTDRVDVFVANSTLRRRSRATSLWQGSGSRCAACGYRALRQRWIGSPRIGIWWCRR